MERLDKILSHCGFGTRKEVKKLIRNKLVMIDDKIVIKDDLKIDPEKVKISVNGNVITYNKFVYLMLNKPSGYISATNDNRYQTVIDLVSEYYKDIFPVGRLDIDTEGLLLLTNDGKLAHDLLAPRKHVEKTYYVEISKKLNSEDVETLENGTIILDGEKIQKAKVEIIDDNAIYLTITEGKFHQIKRMLQCIDNEVTYLKRISMGSLILDEQLKLGEYRNLTQEEIEKLINRN